MNKTFTGSVVSTHMQQTAVVEVVSKKPHPMYKKILTRSKKYKADTKEVPVHVGDVVQIVEIRPLSKDKNFKIAKVLSKKGEPIQLVDPIEEPKPEKKEEEEK